MIGATAVGMEIKMEGEVDLQSGTRSKGTRMVSRQLTMVSTTVLKASGHRYIVNQGPGGTVGRAQSQ